MRRTIPFWATFVLGLGVFSQTARATPETLRRENDVTIVHELGILSNIQLRQPPSPALQVRAGLFAAWNMVRFDDVFWYSVVEQ
jgi:hypothetical protein